MKLLLTSSGLKNKTLKNKFMSLFEDMSATKILFCTTASTVEEDKSFVDTNYDELISLGFKDITKVDFNDLTFEESKKIINENDVIYMEGGNTFYLLDSINKLGLKEYLKQVILSGKVYVGVSAGSIIVGTNINVANIEPADKNDVGIKDLTALNIIDSEISPHCPGIVKLESTKKYANTSNSYNVIAIDDETAIYVTDNYYQIVGEGEGTVFDNWS